MTKTQQSGRLPHRDLKYVDIYREKPVRVTVKVLVPVKEHPKVSILSRQPHITIYVFVMHMYIAIG